ncbi:MAG: hypothetical protein ABI772_12740 [Bacteroidota bacterium]
MKKLISGFRWFFNAVVSIYTGSSVYDDTKQEQTPGNRKRAILYFSIFAVLLYAAIVTWKN